MSNFIGTFKCARGGETMGTSGKVAKMTIIVRSPMKNKDTDEYDSYFLTASASERTSTSACQ